MQRAALKHFRPAEILCKLATPYDGIPRNPLKRTAKRILTRALAAVQAVPGYHRAVQAVDTVTGADEVGWQRKIMYEKTKRMVEQLRPEALDALEISGDRWGLMVK